MREILFRGKRVDNGEWVEGQTIVVIHQDDNDLIFMPQHGEDVKADPMVGNDRALTSIYGNYYQIFPQTVGQYTGLTDKNGRKIFEGDVLKGKFSNYVIRFDEEERAFVYGSSRKGGYIHSLAKYLIGDYKNLRVIGNIHDNPELITCGANSEK